MRGMFRKNKKIIIGLTIIVLVIFVGQKILNSDQSTIEETQTQTVEVSTGNITSSISASGAIQSANYLAVTTSVNGIVKEVFVKEGDRVTKGQKIMEITLNSDGEESRVQAWNSYLSAKNNLESAKNGLYAKESALISAEESFNNEKENNSYQTHDERLSYKLAENDYLRAKGDYDSQKQSINQAQSSVNKAWLEYQAQSPTVIAPDSGTVANIVVVEGMDISNSLSERTSATVASIRKEGTPIASLDVSEVDINYIEVGQKVSMTLNSIDTQTFMGIVVGIDKIGTSASGVANYPVIVKFNEDSDQVLPNMGVDADIITESKDNVLRVPSAALQTNRNSQYVTLVRDTITEDIQIQTGISDGDYTEVISGLNEGDKVLINSLPTTGFTSETNDRSSGGFPGGGSVFIRR